MSMTIGEKSVKKGGKESPKDPIQQAREKQAKARSLGNGAVVFQLVGGKLRTHMVKNRTIANIKGQHEAYRYVKGVKEIKEELQGNLSGLRMEAIVFRLGKIVTGDIALKEFLRIHPDNVANGGNVFLEYNPVLQAEQELAREEAVIEAKYLAMKGLPDEKAYLIAKHLRIKNIDQLSMSEIRNFLKDVAAQNPELFNEMANSPEPKLFSMLVDALTDGKVEFIENGKTLAYKGGGTLLRLPNVASDARLDYVVRWMMSDSAGQEFTEALEHSKDK